MLRLMRARFYETKFQMPNLIYNNKMQCVFNQVECGANIHITLTFGGMFALFYRVFFSGIFAQFNLEFALGHFISSHRMLVCTKYICYTCMHMMIFFPPLMSIWLIHSACRHTDNRRFDLFSVARNSLFFDSLSVFHSRSSS